jgi:hypothetical protein
MLASLTHVSPAADLAALQMDFEQYASAEEPVKEDIKAKPVDTTASVAVAAAA